MPCWRLIPSRFPPFQLFERVAGLSGDPNDARRGVWEDESRRAAVHDPDDYAAGQVLARALRAGGSNGIVYDSVRHAGGACVGVFRPPLLSSPRQERHLCYVWDGTAISTVYEKRASCG